MSSLYADELSFALSICSEVSSIALDYFSRGVDVVTKDDGTPVTRADKEVEAMIREAIARRFPEDDILGEEEGASQGEHKNKSDKTASDRKWIVDPIDGTYNFARGINIWSTLLALEVQSQVVLGIVSAPATGDHYHAVLGGGAFKNGKAIHVSEIDRLQDSLFVFGGPNRIEAAGLWPSVQEAVKSSARQRAFGDYMGFAYVFEGKAEANLEVDLKPWDLAPMKIIAEEAGGCFCDLDGGDSIYKGSCLVTNKHLMPEFKRIFVK